MAAVATLRHCAGSSAAREGLSWAIAHGVGVRAACRKRNLGSATARHTRLLGLALLALGGAPHCGRSRAAREPNQ